MKRKEFLLYGFISGYIFYFGFMTVARFRSFSYYDFDLAVHSLTMWNIIHGSTYNSILGIPFLGNHMHLILFLAAPIYAILPHPLTLLFLQTIALGAAAVPLYRLASRLLDENWALLVSAIYLLYPALAYTNLYEFHPTAFATFFLMATIYYYELKDFKKFAIFGLLAMLCQENISLAIIMTGALALFEKRKLKWIIVPLFAGAFYFASAVLLMRYFNNHTVQYLILYDHLGRTPAEILFRIFTSPKLLWGLLASKQVLIYFAHILMPLSFLPLFAPLKLLPSLAFFAQHFLSKRPMELTIFYHYTAEIIPFLFLSFIYSIRLLLKNEFFRKRQLIFKIFVLVVLVVSNILFGMHRIYWERLCLEYRKDYHDVFKEKFINQIPKDASVMATLELLPHLSGRRFVFSMHHQYTGFYTLSQKTYILPEGIEYALIDFDDPMTFHSFYTTQRYKNIQGLLSRSGWRILGLADSLALLKRDITADERLCGLIEKADLKPKNKTEIIVDKAVELVGFDLERRGQDGFLDITFYWECANPTEKDISFILDITDGNGNLLMRKDHPICYRTFPTNSWQKGQIYKELSRQYLPAVLLEKAKQIKIGFFDYRDGRICTIAGQTDSLGRVLLGAI